MSTTLDAVFSSWPARPWLAAALLASATIYLRGWRALRRRDRARWNAGHLAAFHGGLTVLYLALASPLEEFASLLLQIHMLQHLLLMMVVPPLLWIGAPLVPLLRGLPVEIRRYWIAPVLRWSPLQRFAATITHPAAAWIIFAAATWFWHLPAMYQLALSSDTWHVVQHLCFLWAGLIFWYPVVRPFPARPAWSTWWLVPYLLLADVQNTLLSAWLTFSDQAIYAHYEQMPRLGRISALDDQAAAGVMMWVPGSVAFLVPLAWIGVGLLQGRRSEVGSRVRAQDSALRPPTSDFRPRGQFDLLGIPLLGRVLRSRWTRRLVQSAVLLVILAVIVDGLFGPQVGPMNLAGVVPWIHWRGLVVIGLLAIGNAFCYGCPFTLVRTAGRRLLRGVGGRAWPRWLRTKWLAVGLLGVFLWAYEALALWNNPWLTAWIAIGYFAGALVVDGLFRDAAFCKFVCPIGQFNFVQSLISPLEVRVRRPAVCTTCHTHDCIGGPQIFSLSLGSPVTRRGEERAGVRGIGSPAGCELHLFQPRKSGNLDCTFCLDCVRACPSDNVGVIAVAPTANLWRDGPRSGIGRLSRRFDYAVLALVLVFGAFANAAGMVGPVVDFQQSISDDAGFTSTFFATTLFYVLCLVALPAATITAAAAVSRRIGLQHKSVRELVCRFAWSLIPLGFSMWLAHYSFHFFTSFDTIVPVTQRFAADFHLAALGPPNWVCSCCQPAPDWLQKWELLMLDVGLLASLYAAWRIAWSIVGNENHMRWRAVSIAIPWAILSIALFAAGVWILLQPMQMRGTLPG